MSKNKLRFKDEKGNAYPAWSEKVLGDIVDFSSGKNQKNVQSGKYYNASMGSVEPNGNLINNLRTNSGSVIKSGSLIMPTRDIGAGYVIGKTAVITTDETHVAGNCVFVMKPSYDNPFFLSYYINNSYVRKELVKKVAGSAQLMIKISDVTSLKLVLPSLSEQQKIAGFLSKLDLRIEKQAEKITSLKDYKKGLQQAVFGINGKRTLKFKDAQGNNYPEWEEKTIKELGELNPKGTIPNEFYYIDLESVNKGILTLKPSINKKDAPSRAQRLVSKNDILFQTVRPYQNNNLFFQHDLDKPAIASTGYAQLRVSKYNPMFIFQLISTQLFVDLVLPNCTGSNYPAINTTTFGVLSILIPESFEEQTKIANLFAKVDQQIEKEEALLESYKEQKQGFMQRMF